MIFLMIFITLILIIFVSLSVFGGGQIFMPIFKWLWELLNNNFGAGISDQEMSNLFTVSNATPGVFSTKLAFASGYLISGGQWWGFILCFFTYLVFILTPIIVMFYSMKLMTKKSNSPYLQGLMKIMNPIIVGIIAALIIQLIIGMVFPHAKFNNSVSEYVKISYTSKKALFFNNSRLPILIIYVIITIIISAILYHKRFPIFPLILFNVAMAMIAFAPWAG
ncbi:chromate transporter [Mycoplasma sp. CH-Wi4]|uniref:chromate transporter n=2 Tax=Mycoplasma tauri TaxID=547987 RepID=UPI00196771D4|nr:chromate transporter [Mycoplasma tauri]MBZ4203372.1 chromate transporter [Mycoplasma tauri]MBZ4204229.1 chromate transporter [Mycoplasma tauri]MBZ4212710.1 chromate transporter [Mycoplasma tauri]MBZ4226631.1 chromate transporter [Mycoplasma tauri]QSB07447.1 chromate transporter [Mycoplasma tauri]